ncbi:helix-turn-helix transcriptional regulator [Bacillus gobiensis]|uniref:helix-turn-helix domain-containing protein n=1 Tax=Bacillus gobiensis TaxID=1441095 RepID=UPI003D1971F2
MNTLGQRLRKAREQKGWSQTFVCKKLGISNSALSGYERDYREPDADMIRKLADLYEVSTDFLLKKKEKSGEEVFEDPDLQLAYKDMQEFDEDAKEQAINFIKWLKEQQKGRKPGDKQKRKK